MVHQSFRAQQILTATPPLQRPIQICCSCHCAGIMSRRTQETHQLTVRSVVHNQAQKLEDCVQSFQHDCTLFPGKNVGCGSLSLTNRLDPSLYTLSPSLPDDNIMSDALTHHLAPAAMQPGHLRSPLSLLSLPLAGNEAMFTHC